MTRFSDRDHFRVTTKAAIYSLDASKVLLTSIKSATSEYNPYGLPGGHMDHGETPDQAMVRELKEELGTKVQDLKRKDFFMHSNGKVVLAYIARLSSESLLSSEEPEKEEGQWINRSTFMDIEINPVYRQFVLDNWPNTKGRKSK